MTKIFKTISLEDRWKNSIHSQGPIKPAEVTQGSTELKQPIEPRDYTISQLRLMPDSLEKNSAILKQTIETKGNNPNINIAPFSTKPISDYAIPFTNTKFRSGISLADRLGQPKLGSTTHLAQYFLADAYTDYIKITPFGIFNHTSEVIVRPFNTTVQQGGTIPRTITFNAELAQGLVYINGAYSSFISIQVPTYDSLLLQGTFLSNGVYQSFPSIIVAVGPDSLITNPQTQVSNPTPVGSTTVDPMIQVTNSTGPDANLTNPQITPTAVPSLQANLYLQGVINLGQAGVTSIVVPTTPNNVVQIVPASIILTDPVATVQQGGLNPVLSTATPEQGGLDALPITFEPDRSSPILRLLRYEAQRAAAFFLPRVIHGSANLSNTETKPGYFQNTTTFFDEDPKIAYASGLLRTDFNTEVTGVEVRGDTYTIDYLKSYKNIFGVDDRGGLGSTGQIASALAADKTEGDIKIIEGYIDSVFNVGRDVPRQDNIPKPTATGNNYATLKYEQIRQRAKDGTKNTIQPDFRTLITGQTASDYSVGNTVNERGTLKPDRTVNNDFINLSIKSIRSGTVMQFRAFITSFSDSVNVSWNDVNYVGRQDTLKTFKGSTRGGSIAFKVPCLTKQDMTANYNNLNQLIKSAGVGSASSGDLYLKGPLCSITVGRWFKNTPVIFNSIKYDIQPAEYSWDLDNQMPHLVDVSLDFVVLGDNKGNALNAGSNNYLDYRG